MNDPRREILSQVAAGTITAEEGAARLEALGASPSPAPATPAQGAVKQVKIVSRLGNTDVVGDPSVSVAVADGPHNVRQDGDTMLIEQSAFTDGGFEFSRRLGRTVIDALDRNLTVRVNPALPLTVKVQAGNVRIERIESPLTAEVQAGNCVVTDFHAPITLSVIAGNVEASGQLDSGTSSIKCRMGEVNVSLDRRSSVRIRTRNTMGEVALDGDGITFTGNEARVGSGAGSLDIDCTMGSVRVAVK